MPHIHEKIDFTAEVFIVHKNRVLLRLHDKYKVWLAVGGHIELDEDPMEAAVREAKEEVGLDVMLVGEVPKFTDVSERKELLPPRFLNIHPVSSTHRHITFYYFGRSESDDVRPTGADASHDWKWLNKEELLENRLGIHESIQHYALKALEALS